ncbi:hypothetical protein BD309DRAFT_965632 [Dichomitus squalens]|uniref:Uncharacterized protein n=1 Tax=Dichomitus squalens TaxID=114155 RepID=A0A4Q9MI96_9APHY|nr:uncharacterized protein DICSQDRAFT_47878 [Dichomitus squalens LYAD-421 SS1]EJF67510.1 hypothetical protein DICSQDRAFT_47878 [Dichomitus squalens LYAD-421 SS1]TBU25882.1 hypothetical protein BD311DRAFT_763787 [Dichomitus squalens]TBU41274.1 hypothetical protein BD309DRAFT_965632 [Dichomitus squalens]
MSASSPDFVQEKLTTLLNSPYIHFNQPPQLHGIRLGHGPVDLFSTRFNNYFTSDATGIVAGKEVDKEGLKTALLALQKRWNPDSANFVSQSDASKPTTKFLWTQKNADQPTEISASAELKHEGGSDRIHQLTLDGDESLFA